MPIVTLWYSYFAGERLRLGSRCQGVSGAKGWEGTSAQSEHMDKLPCCLGHDQMWVQGLWVIASSLTGMWHVRRQLSRSGPWGMPFSGLSFIGQVYSQTPCIRVTSALLAMALPCLGLSAPRRNLWTLFCTVGLEHPTVLYGRS